MPERPTLRRLFRLATGRSTVEEDARDELTLHAELLTQELVDAGMPPQEASAEATRRLGNLSRITREMIRIDRKRRNSAGRAEFINQLLLEIRYAFRRLLRAPAVSIGAIAAFAIGIGATTTMFSIGHSIMTPLPFPEPDRMVMILGTDRVKGLRRVGDLGLRAREFLDIREQNRTLTQVAVFASDGFHLGDGRSAAERVRGARVTGRLFTLLGVQPEIGREILPSDETPGASPVVVLGHKLWRDRFGGDPGVLGSTIRVSGTLATVIGVMPADFAFPGFESIWMPLAVDRITATKDTSPQYEVIGRLRDRVSIDQARAEVIRLGATITADRGGHLDREGLTVLPAANWSIQPEGRLRLYGMTLIISFVLLIACANVANLLIARAAAKSQETAVRVSLGASRFAIVRSFATECLILALIGGSLAACLAQVGVTLFGRAVAFELPSWIHFGVDRTILLFVFGLILLSALATGLVPGSRSANVNPADLLRGAVAGGTQFRLARLSQGLVTIQVALAATLLIIAGLIIEGDLISLGRTPVRAPEEIASGRIELRTEAYPTAVEQGRFVTEVLDRLRQIPGATAVAAGTATPGFGGPTLEFETSGTASDPKHPLQVAVSAVSPDFFATFGIPILSGREFAITDRVGGTRVAIVTQRFAARYLHDRSAVGSTIRIGDPRAPFHPNTARPEWVTIVGIVADVPAVDANAFDESGVFLPILQVGDERVAFAIRGKGAPADLLKPFRQAVFAVDPDVPVFGAGLLSEKYAEATASQKVFSGLFAAFGLAGLVLASVGLFALVALRVRQRAREIGIRMALGEPGRTILWSLTNGVGRRIAVGLAIGVGLAYLLAPLLGEVLLGASPHDPLIFGGVTGAIVLVSGLAVLLPAYRALRLDPIAALRSE